MKRLILMTLTTLLAVSHAEAGRLKPELPWTPMPQAENVRASCKQASSCAEAVLMWCNGYFRADADHDGVPCENVCHSRGEVEAIEAEIGCSL